MSHFKSSSPLPTEPSRQYTANFPGSTSNSVNKKSSFSSVGPRSPSSSSTPSTLNTEQQKSETSDKVQTSISSRSAITTPDQPTYSETEYNERRCWICFGEDGDSEGRWVSPCQCSLIAHEKCLLRWMFESQKKEPLKQVTCPQCAFPYSFQQKTSLSYIMITLGERALSTIAPYFFGFTIGCSIIIAATTLGAFTVVTVMGPKDSERLIGNPAQWTWRAWVGLPLIPATLLTSIFPFANVYPFVAFTFMSMASRSYRRPSLNWPPSVFDVVIGYPMVRMVYVSARNATYRLVVRRSMLRSSSPRQSLGLNASSSTPQLSNIEQNNENSYSDIQPINDIQIDEIETRRMPDILLSSMCALLLPFTGSALGNLLTYFKPVKRYFPAPFHRTILGGCILVVSADIIDMWYAHSVIRQHQSRRIRNYSEIKQRH
ncbi:hypothetical protein PHYBLDRAFT_71997 [Phycomyces blakesleeanus NRRL 1555(-)]|uniref:RING-CH-type domain-containing protein n=1 Tax=Phycomyces blakesleeanus (strain ATCC 8743b / DSM 1359 / FGSC 10004 / NBRC 33097 / NRRL 1555) TaxID=763407 RepID=A0A167N7K4_PHYB8|nr:hypothetical protein PHYBLDRAFT_71997 [Phycomyces blakesleeanus NRRL 1555(-)]OAD75239.1 hypothetical protein PHYBLDRAFT_71997 [Phycomyces blakesleeanus NRRL 1555(-)]|eukprot:XP_018293279.1 hypothetical protein PHYBLDRAFT_71997 [Phycomyces blakesleeanus NRRL 1555(-)]